VPADDRSIESFADLVLQLRARIGLTQRELAARLGVHAHSVQGWEAGTSYPGAPSLQALIAAVLRAGGFTAGRERDEAGAFWASAMREAPRFRLPFDQTWFEGLLGETSGTGGGADTRGQRDGPGSRAGRSSGPAASARAASSAAIPTQPATPSLVRQQSWGEAPDVTAFVGRAAERERLRRWILDEHCRLVAVLGLGGIGKSILSARLAHDLAPSFERVLWRTMTNAPPPDAWLADALGFLAPAQPATTGGEGAQIRRLLELLDEARCLLVLDNVETALQPGDTAGSFRPGYERYGELIQRLGESPHQSCLLLTSREAPIGLGVLAGESGAVRTLALGGFGVEDGRSLLRDKYLEGDEASWQVLIERYGGNGLALKMIGETIRELFGGEIGAYLDDVPAAQGAMIGGVRQLLQAQIERLSGPERDLIRSLAVAREPVRLAELASDPRLRLHRGALLGAVDGLRRRSLLEPGERQSSFTLQPVVLEYVTEQLIEDVLQELRRGDPVQLRVAPLLKATAREYVRLSQERLIAAPLLERFVAAEGGAAAAERQLVACLDELRELNPEAQGYGPGNLVNLLRLLRGDLRGADLSGLAIREAYLQEVEAQDASLAGAHLSEVMTSGAFHYPTQVSLSADGTHLATATSTGEVYLWRIADRALLATLRGHDGAVWGVALSPDGRLVASGGFDQTVRLWDAASGRLLATFQGHTGGVNGVALSADGRLVASGSYDGTVKLWEAASGRLLRTLEGHGAGVNGVALSADGQRVVSGSWDGSVRLWDTETGALLARLEGHTGGVWGVALSSDGATVASGSFDGTVRLWEARTGQVLATLQGHSGGVRGVALGNQGRLVASGSYDGTVKLWAAENGRLLATLQGHLGGVWGVALTDDGAVVASASYDGTVKLWETERRRLVASLQGQTAGVWSIALSGDGDLLASAGVDGSVKLWRPDSGQVVSSLRGHTGGVWGVALSRDGRILVSGSFDGTVRVWAPGLRRSLVTLRGHTSGIQGVAVSGDGWLAASAGFDGTVRLWEAPGGKLVASGGYDEAIKLWEAPGGRLLATLRGHAGGVRGVALSDDRRLVASSGVDETVRVWDVQSGRLLQTLPGHLGGALDVALSADGRLVASGSEDGIVRLWDVESGAPLASLRGHTGQVYGVAFLGNERVVSGSIDGTVRFWDVGSGACVRTLRADRRYERMDITGVTGISEAQREALIALGATEQAESAGLPSGW
jgi:WD40 repeat protein/transcriptional regulator with XRE-family HTH domain